MPLRAAQGINQYLSKIRECDLDNNTLRYYINKALRHPVIRFHNSRRWIPGIMIARKAGT